MYTRRREKIPGNKSICYQVNSFLIKGIFRPRAVYSTQKRESSSKREKRKKAAAKGERGEREREIVRERACRITNTRQWDYLLRRAPQPPRDKKSPPDRLPIKNIKYFNMENSLSPSRLSLSLPRIHTYTQQQQQRRRQRVYTEESAIYACARA